MATCRICRADGIRDWLDFGPQTLTNRFLRSRHEAEYTHPCKVGACRACGTVQLESPVPVEEMRPRFDWIFYNEPERHLDEVAGVLAALPGVGPDAVIGGVTYKDESTLKRLNALGRPRTWLAHLRDDLGVESPLGGIESVQDALTPDTARRLAAKYGRPDVLLVRHVLEHSYDPHRLMAAVRDLLAPGGYVLFEMPDARKALDRLDYTTVWEEHLFYFSPDTLRRCLAGGGFEPVYLHTFPSPQEDILVAVARVAAARPEPPAAGVLAGELARADRFVAEFPRVKDEVGRFVRGHGKAALLGAGHLSGAFINLYGLDDAVDFVADDNPKKHGLYMPGSKAPILPSSELLARPVGLCLMTVRAEVEAAVAAKNAAFADRGGVLASVFPDSPRYYGNPGRPAGKAALAMSIVVKSDEVHQATGGVVRVTSADVAEVVRKGTTNARKRARLCAHPGPDDRLHEMLIVLDRGTYIRPHRHANKAESFHLIEGELDVVIFHDDGTVREVVRMGPYGTPGKAFYYRIMEPAYHAVLVNTPYALFHETTNGPFVRGDGEFAPWSPAEGEPGVAAYVEQLRGRAAVGAEARAA